MKNNRVAAGIEKTVTVIGKYITGSAKYIALFVKWMLMSLLVGTVSGLIGTLFDVVIHRAAHFQSEYKWLLWLLPAGGLVIVLIYRICGIPFGLGTNRVLEAIDSDEKNVPHLLAPVIFIGTTLTHLLGGSAGREGAALQFGGSLAETAALIFKLRERDKHIIIMCGMAGMFSAMFGTPVTAAIFAMEVTIVGEILYFAIVPCFVAAVTAYGISDMLGIEPVRFYPEIPEFNIEIMLRTIVLAFLIALLSKLFLAVMNGVHHFAEYNIRNEYLRIFIGGALMVGIAMIFGRDYTGAGMNIIERAVAGEALPSAFIVKMIATAVTIGFGYRGGEIVPTLFIGSTFGCVVGPYIGLDPGYAAAVSMTSLFCGVTNTPTASILLAAEMFGGHEILLFALAIAITFKLSGHGGLYSSQRRYKPVKAAVSAEDEVVVK